jgi:proteasome lid subunit RPN8/RPN11
VTQKFLHISDADATTILRAAAARYPSECCGLLEGTATPDGWRVSAVHEAANIADDPKRHFLIDPQQQFGLFRALRGTKRDIIGCFHSHPNGPAEPSATDLAQAIGSEFVWLIAGGKPNEFGLNAYLFTGSAFEPLRMIQST